MKTLIKLIVVVALIALAYEGYIIYKKNAGASAQEGAQSADGGGMPAMPVPVLSIAEKPIEIWKEFSGRLTAVDYVEIRPQVSGTITSINFNDGQIVEAGDVLITIDPRPYEAAVQQAKADVAAAAEDAAYAQVELNRAKELLDTGAVSRQGYDQRVNSLKVNKSARAAADARLKAAEVDLDRAAIKAPIRGRVSRPEITLGNLVTSANAPLMTTIVSDNGIFADFEVDEPTYLSFVRGKVGQDVQNEKEIPVRIMLNDAKTAYTGKILSFDNRINPGTGTIRARAMFANEDGVLLPGMFAKVQIGSPQKENRIMVPETAISTDQSRKFVYVVAGDNAATYREVTLGDVANGERIVLSGLKPGDRVITDGIMKIRPGAKVDPKTPEQMEQMKAQMAAQAQQGQPPSQGGEEKNTEEAKEPDGQTLQAAPEDAPAEAKGAEDASVSPDPKNTPQSGAKE